MTPKKVDAHAAQERDFVKSKKTTTYEVTLRRDVQQVTCVRVQAFTRQQAIDTANAVSGDDAAWNIEEYVGSHKPHARKVPR